MIPPDLGGQTSRRKGFLGVSFDEGGRRPTCASKGRICCGAAFVKPCTLSWCSRLHQDGTVGWWVPEDLEMCILFKSHVSCCLLTQVTQGPKILTLIDIFLETKDIHEMVILLCVCVH